MSTEYSQVVPMTDVTTLLHILSFRDVRYD